MKFCSCSLCDTCRRPCWKLRRCDNPYRSFADDKIPPDHYAKCCSTTQCHRQFDQTSCWGNQHGPYGPSRRQPGGFLDDIYVVTARDRAVGTVERDCGIASNIGKTRVDSHSEGPPRLREERGPTPATQLFALRASSPVCGQASAWSPNMSTCCPQPGEGPERPEAPAPRPPVQAVPTPSLFPILPLPCGPAVRFVGRRACDRPTRRHQASCLDTWAQFTRTIQHRAAKFATLH